MPLSASQSLGYLEHALLHRADIDGWIHIGRHVPEAAGRRWRQETVRAADLDARVAKLQGAADVYVSQASTRTPVRQTLELQGLRVLWLDIDVKLAPADFVASATPVRLDALRRHARETIGLEPSWIVSSKRGFHLKWRLEEVVTKRHLPQWRATMRYLHRLFRFFGADGNASDPMRLLRIPGTVNSRSGGIAEIIHVTESIVGAPYAYSLFDLLERAGDACRRLDPRGIDTGNGRKATGARKGGRSLPFDARTWYSLALDDLRALRRQRYGDGPVVIGNRDLHLFYEINLLALIGMNAAELKREALLLRQEIAPTWPDRRVASVIATLLRRVQKHERGERIEYPAGSGQQLTPIYTPSREKIVDTF